MLSRPRHLVHKAAASHGYLRLLLPCSARRDFSLWTNLRAKYRGAVVKNIDERSRKTQRLKALRGCRLRRLTCAHFAVRHCSQFYQFAAVFLVARSPCYQRAVPRQKGVHQRITGTGSNGACLIHLKKTREVHLTRE